MGSPSASWPSFDGFVCSALGATSFASSSGTCSGLPACVAWFGKLFVSDMSHLLVAALIVPPIGGARCKEPRMLSCGDLSMPWRPVRLRTKRCYLPPQQNFVSRQTVTCASMYLQLPRPASTLLSSPSETAACVLRLDVKKDQRIDPESTASAGLRDFAVPHIQTGGVFPCSLL